NGSCIFYINMTMSNIRTFADELRAAVEQAAVKRASERPAKRLRPAPPVANLVAQTLPEQTAPATNLVIRQVANSTDSSGQPEKDTEKAENPTANGETKDLEPNGAKAPKRELVRQTSFEERLDALVNNLDLSEVEIEDTPLPPEEQSRKDFADRLDRNLDEDKLVGMLEELKTKAPSWGALRRMRSIGLLVVHV
ncbi:DNA polymerase beta, partial [Durusdinium trenchii]